jgi:hypothetical protein
VLQDGLELNEARHVPGYPVATYTTGLRNMTGRVNDNGTVTIFAITAQTSTISGGEPDPTKLVMITDALAATVLPTNTIIVPIVIVIATPIREVSKSS